MPDIVQSIPQRSFPALSNSIRSGEIAGATSATVLPTVVGGLVILKACAANAGAVYIGLAGVTKVDGSTDTTTGIQLMAGDSITLSITNLNVLYLICDNTGDALTYLITA